MVNKPLIRPYFLGGVAFGGVARIPLKVSNEKDPGYLLYIGDEKLPRYTGITSYAMK